MEVKFVDRRELSPGENKTYTVRRARWVLWTRRTSGSRATYVHGFTTPFSEARVTKAESVR